LIHHIDCVIDVDRPPFLSRNTINCVLEYATLGGCFPHFPRGRPQQTAGHIHTVIAGLTTSAWPEIYPACDFPVTVLLEHFRNVIASFVDEYDDERPRFYCVLWSRLAQRTPVWVTGMGFEGADGGMLEEMTGHCRFSVAGWTDE